MNGKSTKILLISKQNKAVFCAIFLIIESKRLQSAVFLRVYNLFFRFQIVIWLSCSRIKYVFRLNNCVCFTNCFAFCLIKLYVAIYQSTMRFNFVVPPIRNRWYCYSSQIIFSFALSTADCSNDAKYIRVVVSFSCPILSLITSIEIPLRSANVAHVWRAT